MAGVSEWVQIAIAAAGGGGLGGFVGAWLKVRREDRLRAVEATRELAKRARRIVVDLQRAIVEDIPAVPSAADALEEIALEFSSVLVKTRLLDLTEIARESSGIEHDAGFSRYVIARAIREDGLLVTSLILRDTSGRAVADALFPPRSKKVDELLKTARDLSGWYEERFGSDG